MKLDFTLIDKKQKSLSKLNVNIQTDQIVYINTNKQSKKQS